MYFLYKNEHRIFKSVEIAIRSGRRQKEKYRGDEPMWLIVHVDMEMSPGNQ
jgi:hypothetical protein